MFKSNFALILLLLNLIKGPNFANLNTYTSPSEISPTITTIENAETIAFNKDLKLYVGNNVSASQTKALIGIIQSSNNNNTDKKIVLELNGITHTTNEELLEAINDISTATAYTISFEYSPSGFINKSIIKANNPVPTPTPTPAASTTPSASPGATTEPTTTPVPTATPTPTPIHGDVTTTVTF